METPLLETEKVSKSFGFPVLSHVSLHVNAGERFGLIGPNGSGKTTLINLITGVSKCDSGRVLFSGKEITNFPANVRARMGIARTFQIPKPFVSMSVLENLTIPLRYAPVPIKVKARATDEAMRILRLVGMDSRADASPSELTQIGLRSLELARALALRPKVLILDEVMAGLSSSEVDEILTILMDLNQNGIAVIMIEHIMRAVMSFCQRISVLNAGMKIAEGSPEEILKNKEVEKAYLGE